MPGNGISRMRRCAGFTRAIASTRASREWSPSRRGCERLEKQMTERALDEITSAIPPEWYADDYDA